MKLYLKEYREFIWYTQQEVANYIWISRPSYTQRETGVSELKNIEWRKIAEMFLIAQEKLYEEPDKSDLINTIIRSKRARFINLWKELFLLWYKEIGDDIYEIMSE